MRDIGFKIKKPQNSQITQIKICVNLCKSVVYLSFKK